MASKRNVSETQTPSKSQTTSSNMTSNETVSEPKKPSKLEEAILYNNPVQESILRNLPPRDFLRMRLAGVRISPSLTRKLQSKYLLAYCSESDHFVNNMKDFDDGIIVQPCTNKNPRSHNYLDNYACKACIDADPLGRSAAEDMLLLSARRKLCSDCTAPFVPAGFLNFFYHEGCTCREETKSWECSDCWNVGLQNLENKISADLGQTQTSCATPGCGGNHLSEYEHEFLTDEDDIKMFVSGIRCMICKGTSLAASHFSSSRDS